MANSKDVAKEAGVSVATVSRVFSGFEGIVSDKTKARVYAAAQKLGYSPNFIARNLKVCHSNTIGLLIPNSSNPFFLQVMNIIAQDLKTCGYNLLVSFCHENQEDEYKNIVTLLSSRVDALLFTPVCFNPDVIKLLTVNNTYALQLNRRFYPQLDAVVWNDVLGLRNATDCLLDRGFRRLMLLGPVASRQRGFMEAHSQRKLAIDEEQIVQTSDTDINADFLREHLERYRPDAIISVAHETNYCVLSILKELKWDYPNDISIICYDDDELTRFLELTVVAHDLVKLGHEACDLLIDSIHNQEHTSVSRPAVCKMLETKLIYRNSVGFPTFCGSRD